MKTKTTTSEKDLRRMAVDLVSAFVSGISVSAEELPQLIRIVYGALSALEKPGDAGVRETLKPAVIVGRSVTRNRIVCLEDGKTFKVLKRHLRTAHDLTPDEYRTKWGLRDSYPMVAPGYSVKRSELAKKMEFGQRARRGSGSGEHVTEAA
ncbi:MAG: MucR family transcriptional regulator [Rhodospirillales bacterium]|nr:MucR family transcriptional regulator [Rhodospirillales bacterium]MDH3919533.1 MucR family transcriptional regulator [Rhodospirillales bacterium]